MICSREVFRVFKVEATSKMKRESDYKLDTMFRSTE